MIKKSIICTLVLMVIVFALNAKNKQRSLLQEVLWANTDINRFILNSDVNTTAAAFLIQADILETPGEKLATIIPDYPRSKDPELIWVDPSILKICRFYYKNKPNPNAGIFIQLAGFPTQWKPGNTLRLKATLLDNNQSADFDIVLPKGKKNIVIKAPFFFIPEYSLEHLGQEHFGPADW